MRSRRTAGYAAHKDRRCDADRSEEWCKFQSDAGRKLAGSCLLIHTNELDFRVREVFRKRAASGNESSHPIWMKKLDRLDLDFETITRLSTFDVDGPS